jgi:methionyl-tRNA formyltransferase
LQSKILISLVPIKAVARELGLSIHERDTFTGWEVGLSLGAIWMLLIPLQLPQPEGEAINLIVAVSFGLFIPPRILKSAEYGGLNVHPSLLPKYGSSSFSTDSPK